MKINSSTLHDLYHARQGHVSDKWSLYLDEYERLFAPFRASPIRLLEIGVQNGGSLEIWRRYFPMARRLIGCDINPECHNIVYDDPKISVIVGDINNINTIKKIFGKSDSFDIIIDDGSHRSSDIVKTFANYFHVLSDAGVYVTEDLHCSYWSEFEGGLYAPYSALSFFKRLADIVGQEHWGIRKSSSELLSGFSKHYGATFDGVPFEHIHSVEFINSMCVIRKSLPANNRLGRRIISGSTEQVTHSLLEMDSTISKPPIQEKNLFSNMPMAPDEAYFLLAAELGAKEARINCLNAKMNACEALLVRILMSWSWRMAWIFRKVGAVIRKVTRCSKM